MARRSNTATATATATPAPAQAVEPEGNPAEPGQDAPVETPTPTGDPATDPQTEVFRLDKTSDKLHMAYYKRAGFPQRIGLPMSHVQGSEAPTKVTVLLHDDHVWAQPAKLTPEKRLAALTPAARAKVQAELDRLIAAAEAE